MKIDVITIFPQMFTSVLGESILKRAQETGKVQIDLHDLRHWATDNHKSVDAPPFGGGPGMIMRVDVVDRAIEAIKVKNKGEHSKIILLDTKGKLYNQPKAEELSKLDHLILIVPHYEGIDHRVHDHLVDEVISIGEYVLTGGEIPALVVIDSVVRLLPGVLGNSQSLLEESYQEAGKQEYPQYTRPAEYKGWKVPEVLTSGNHQQIKRWRDSFC